jgi:hypothetical protein
MGDGALGDQPRDSLYELQKLLWEGTVRNAFSTEMYKDLWHGLDVNDIVGAGVSALSYLPIVTKQMIVDAGDRSRVMPSSPCYDVLSGGTTGSPLLIKRGRAEMEFLTKFFSHREWKGDLPRGLCFTAPYHGTLVPMPALGHQHQVNIYDTECFNYAFNTLSRRYSDLGFESSCSYVSGQERVLNAFCLFLESKTQIDRIAVPFALPQGACVTPSVRERLERVLSCKVVDRYSMSEIFGGASEDIVTGWYHPDPHLVYEVIDPISKQRIEEGLGALVVTVLYPYQQVQPMVRYFTGDLVETTLNCPTKAGCTVIKPLGRLDHSIQYLRTGDWILSGMVLYEIMDGFSKARRRPLFLDTKRSVVDPYKAGFSAFQLVQGKNFPQEVILRFEAQDPKLAEIAEIELKEKFLRHPASGISHALDSRDFHFSVVAMDEVKW